MNKTTTLQVDESKSGLGAALFQDSRPIAMAPKALDDTQTSYMLNKYTTNVLHFSPCLWSATDTTLINHQSMCSLSWKIMGVPLLQRNLLIDAQFQITVT